ncbi:Rha family transcriptional regulator [Enterobacter kobei]|uniref:Rha family transcriptional regulator n=1 Tax=Enterobacter kobei TaxID=208224 RepID=UPI0006832326|nr:Rha family transcriptional regulator [Enterobacter kobei]
MINSISCVIPEITIRNDRPVTTSIAVANYFGKQHRDVTKKIRSLECSPSFTSANFFAVVVTAQAGFDEREIEAFEMTKNGFIFLVMGFTGKRAAAFKEAYIAEFDRMESELLKQNTQPSVPAMPIFPIGINFQYVVTVESGCVIEMRPLRQGEMVASAEDLIWMLRKTGWVVELAEDMAAMKSMDLAQLIQRSAAMQIQAF